MQKKNLLKTLLLVEMATILAFLFYLFVFPMDLVDSFSGSDSINDATATAVALNALAPKPSDLVVSDKPMPRRTPVPEAVERYNRAMNGEPEKAEQELRLAIAIDPSFAEARLYLAILLFDTKRFNEAELESKLALSLYEEYGLLDAKNAAPLLSQMHLLLAMVNIHHAQTAAESMDLNGVLVALAEVDHRLRESLRLNPDNLQAKQMAEQLIPLKKLVKPFEGMIQ